MMMNSKQKLQAVMERDKSLTYFGYGVSDPRHKSKSQIAEEYAELREELLNNTEQFEKVVELMQQVGKIKCFNTKHSSYGLKHTFQRVLGAYVANGMFIAAAMHCGFDCKRVSYGSPNARFNMSEKSLKLIEQMGR